MDHRLIEIDENDTILLDRLEHDEPQARWQVMISTFADIDSRYDEWVGCSDPHQARAFITDFSETSAREFLVRAHEWHATKQPAISEGGL